MTQRKTCKAFALWHGYVSEMPFTCEYPGCEKAYIRKEHLTRHQKDHTKSRVFQCSLCSAEFKRKYGSSPPVSLNILIRASDSLRRHLLLHELPNPAERASQACLTCHAAKARCVGERPRCTRCHDRGIECEWPPQDTEAPHPQQPQVVSLPQEETAKLELMWAGESSQNMLADSFFRHLHQQWAILHRGSFMKKAQHESLFQTVMAIGLWFHLSKPVDGPKRAAIENYHDSLFAKTTNQLVSTMYSSSRYVGELTGFSLPG